MPLPSRPVVGPRGLFGPARGAQRDLTEAEVERAEREAEKRGLMAQMGEQIWGLGKIALDLVSRTEFAEAAAFQAAFERGFGPGSIGAAGQAAFKEIFSGVAGIEGQKKGVAEVLEGIGVGAGPTVGQLVTGRTQETMQGVSIPQGFVGGPLDPSMRGVGSFLIATALDPLTYITAGQAAAVKMGGKALTKKGATFIGREFERFLPKTIEGAIDLRLASPEVRRAAVDAARAADELVPLGKIAKSIKVGEPGFAEAQGVAMRQALESLEGAVEAGATGLLDKGAIKFAGITVPGTPRLATAMSGLPRRTAKMLGEASKKTPGISYALYGPWQMKEKFLDKIPQMLRISWHAGHIKDYMDLRQQTLNDLSAAYRAIGDEIATLPKDWTPERWRHVINVAEAGNLGVLAPDEKDVAVKILSIGRRSAELELSVGALKADARKIRTLQRKIAGYDAALDPTVVERTMSRADAERLVRKHAGAVVDPDDWDEIVDLWDFPDDLWAIIEKPKFREAPTAARRRVLLGERKRLIEGMPTDTVDLQWVRDDEAMYLLRRGWKPVQKGGKKLLVMKSKPVPSEAQDAFFKRLEDINSELNDLDNVRMELVASGEDTVTVRRLRHVTEKEADKLARGKDRATEKLREIMQGRGLRDFYVPHFFDNTPEEWSRITTAMEGSFRPSLSIGDLGRHRISRKYPSLAVFEADYAKKVKKDPTLPPLRAVYDGREIIRRRLEKTIDVMTWRKTLGEVERRWGLGAIPKQVDEIFAIADEPAKSITPEEIERITNLLGAEPYSIARGLATERRGMRREFIGQSLARAKTPEDVWKVMDAFRDYADDFPRYAHEITPVAADGSALVPYTLPTTKRTYLIPDSIRRDLEWIQMRGGRLPVELETFLKWAFDVPQNAWKKSVTAYFPSFHYRNFYTNQIALFTKLGIRAWDPVLLAHTAEVIAGRQGVMRQRYTGIQYTYDELRKMALEMNVKIAPAQALQLTGEAERKLVKAGPVQQFAAAVENEGRVQMWLGDILNGADPQAAAKTVREWLVDYQHGFSPVEKEILARLFPFYRWQRQNLRNMMRSFVQVPGRQAAVARTVRMRQDEEQGMASWQAGGTMIRLQRDGKNLVVLSGIDLPQRNLDLLWKGTTKKTALGVLANVGPNPLKVAAEIVTGYRFFQGRQIKRQESTTAGYVLDDQTVLGQMIDSSMTRDFKNWIGYQKTIDKAGRARYTFEADKFYLLFQSWIFSRVMSTSDNQFRLLAQDPDWRPVLVNFFTGLKLVDLDMNEQQQIRLKERMRLIQELDVEAGRKREYQIYYTPRQKGYR